ncbi:MAG: diadenylate cyclase [Candidatus Methylomirabilales bacterium]
MESGPKVFQDVWAALEQLWFVFRRFPGNHLLDIGLMTFVVYQVYVRFRGTRAMRILAGVVLLGLGYLLAQAAGLYLTAWVLGGVWAAALIIVIILFQGEIRQMLEQVNPRFPLKSMLRGVSHVRLPEESLVTVAETAFTTASNRSGALLLFERHDFLEPLLRSPGILIDAQVSPELLETIFSARAPLHDGAVYLRAGRAYRAGCVLPLSEKPRLAPHYGTRHRAALGISEQSDAVVVVVSEERGKVSVVEHGKIAAVDTPADLLTWLTERLVQQEKRSRRWALKTLLTHNWRPKLIALASVSLLWFVLVGQQNAEVGFKVPLVYDNVPKELSIVGRREQVYVRLRGSREMLNLLDPSRLRVTIDLKKAEAGSNRYSISLEDINVPPGLQLAEVNPSRILVRMREMPPESNEKR